MEAERRSLEISRMVNLIAPKGWEEAARGVEGDKLTVSFHKNLEGASLVERRMFMDDLKTIIQVFGWSVTSELIEEMRAEVSLEKTLVTEVPKEPGQ